MSSPNGSCQRKRRSSRFAQQMRSNSAVRTYTSHHAPALPRWSMLYYVRIRGGRYGGDPSMACKGSGVQIPLSSTRHNAAVDQVIGPAWLGYADRSDLRPAPTLGTRLLTDQDLPELQRLAAACGPVAWEHSGIDPARSPVFGCFAGDRLAAAGMLERWGDRLLHVGVVTHPGYRGCGYGKAVVSAMSTYGLATGGVMQYRPCKPTSLRSGSPGRSASSALPSPWPCGSSRPVEGSVC
jgi:GNAT superfamily N-acetyltransferase